MKKILIDSMESWEGIIASIYKKEDGSCIVEFSKIINTRHFNNYDSAASWLYKIGFIW